MKITCFNGLLVESVSSFKTRWLVMFLPFILTRRLVEDVLLAIDSQDTVLQSALPIPARN